MCIVLTMYLFACPLYFTNKDIKIKTRAKMVTERQAEAGTGDEVTRVESCTEQAARAVGLSL